MNNDTMISFEDFKTEWLKEVTENNPTTVQLGNRFARKLVTQWLDFDDNNDDMIFCDGSGDGGIDVAYLKRSEKSDDGDTWYLIQSKYGTAFNGKGTLLIEAQKIIDTIDGKSRRLSSIAFDLLERLQTFKSSSSPKDKLILVFATNTTLTEDEKRVLNDVKAFGKARLGDFFDTEAVSIETIYQRVSENLSLYKKYKLSFNANLVPSGNDLLVGSIKLINLYQFLKDYKVETGDLDLIYEKNVRKFLGAGKVNKGIAETLRDKPERFGLYNNGITIVVEDFEQSETDKYELTEPYIVNGCQTTRTIWDYLYKKLESGGTGINVELEDYKKRLNRGIVVVKVVKIGENGNELLTETTRYTNSQNAVGKKDFIALEKDFRTLQREMKDCYNINLEIQRGGSDSIRAVEKLKPNMKKFDDHVNAFELLKNYGAAWLNEPGTAFAKNEPFAPNGYIFNQIFDKGDFNINDLYASYLLHKLTSIKIKFGRGTENPATRGKTRYLFYHVLAELLKDCMSHSNIQYTNPNLSISFINIFYDIESDAANQLVEAAINVIDDYMTDSNEDSVFREPNYANDMNNYMKFDKLGKGSSYTPKLNNLIAFAKRDMRRNIGGQKSARDIVCESISNNMHSQVTNQLIEDTNIGDCFKIDKPSKGVFAKGCKTNDDGNFVVFAGAKISSTTASTMPSRALEIRKKCISDGTIVNGVFTKDYEFTSWSSAACVLLGCSSSGPNEWKRDN